MGGYADPGELWRLRISVVDMSTGYGFYLISNGNWIVNRCGAHCAWPGIGVEDCDAEPRSYGPL